MNTFSGDADSLKDLLGFEPETREHAGRILSGPPESIVARTVVKNFSTDAVQLIAEQLQGFDEAVEFLALRAPDGKTRCLHLRLQRHADGWRLIVPAHAVEAVVRDLSGAPPLPVTDPFRDAPHAPEP